MKHEIGIDDIKEAMKAEIILASSCNSRVRKSKSLKFVPHRLVYVVAFKLRGLLIEKEEFKHPTEAVTRYNEHNV